ncbi:MAG: SDR family oxidoreductase [Sedimentibacter sp.]
MLEPVTANISDSTNLEGQVAIITGGVGGIGSEVVNLFRKYGAKVYALDMVDDNYEKNIYNCNITNQKNVIKVVDDVYDKEGKIDILVNCAGITSTVQFLDLTEEEWDRIFDVNMKGTFFVTQAVFPKMKERKYGKIVCFSSVAGRNAGIQAGPHYSASKAAVLVFSRCIAKEGAPYGIYSNCVVPGPTDTDMIKDFDPEKKAAKNFPLHRIGNPLDLAHAALFLASQQSNWITGVYLDVNGGLYMG